MTTILDYIENHPQETQRLIGLEYDQWQQLMKNVEALNTEKQAKRVLPSAQMSLDVPHSNV